MHETASRRSSRSGSADDDEGVAAAAESSPAQQQQQPPSRGIMRPRPSHAPPRASSSDDQRSGPDLTLWGSGLKPEGGGVWLPRRGVPSLTTLARDALLYGLADGHAMTLSEVAQSPPAGPEATLATPIPYANDDDKDEGDRKPPARPPFAPAGGSSAALLHDERFWDGLMAEAYRRRILSDSFLTALCASGLPPTRLELGGWLGEAGIADRFLAKSPPREEVGRPGGEGRRSFASASEMMIASLRHLRLSGGGGGGETGDEPDALGARRPDPGGGAGGGSAVERLAVPSDIESVLHRVARSAAHLRTLRLGPGLLQHKGSDKWLGALRAVVAQCPHLEELSVRGLSFGSDEGESSAGGAGGGSGSAGGATALFEAVASGCASLGRLSLARCPGVRDRHGQALLLELRVGTASVPSLAELDLSFTDVGGLTFAALCGRGQLGGQPSGRYEGIRRLILDGTSIDEPWLKRILESLGDRLEELSLLSCPKLRRGPNIWSAFVAAAKTSDGYGLGRLSKLSLELNFGRDVIVPRVDKRTGGAGERHVREERFAPASSRYHGDPSLDCEARSQYYEYYSLHHDNDGAGGGAGAAQPDDGGHGWSCRRCTLINDPQSIRCAACNKRRFRLPIAGGTVARPPGGGTGWDARPADGPRDGPETAPPEAGGAFLDLGGMGNVPLSQFVGVLHAPDARDGHKDEAGCVRRDAAGSSSSSSSECAVLLARGILCALPPGLGELSLSLPCAKGGGAQSLVLGTDECRTLAERFGPSLRSLELGGVSVGDGPALARALSSLPGLRRLKLLGAAGDPGGLGIPTGAALRAASVPPDGGDGGCRDLEILHLCSSPREHDGNDEVMVSFPSLARLWIQGGTDLRGLDITAPRLERLTVSGCPSLASLALDGSAVEEYSSKLEHLCLSGVPSLSPHSISSLRLPRLKCLDVDTLALVEDWEFGTLVRSAGNSLTSLRLNQCRWLGDVSQWTDPDAPFRPLSVLHIRQPSPALDMRALRGLFDGQTWRRGGGNHGGYGCSLRDLIIEDAPGLRGVLRAAPALSSHHTPHNSWTGAGEDVAGEERLAAALSRSPGGGGAWAIDPLSSPAATERLGARGIRRILSDFVEGGGGNGGEGGGNDEYGFPPTLTSYQRKLVHEAAEGMSLEHESVTLNTGARVVRVRRRRAAAAMGALDDVEGADVNASGTTAHDVSSPSIWLSPRPNAHAPQQGETASVTFALDKSDEERFDGTINEDDTHNGSVGVFELDEDDGAISSSAAVPGPDQASDHDAEQTQDEPVKARSRRDLRKARKAAKKKDPEAEDLLSESDDGGGDDGEAAFDPLLQCERFASFDPKIYRRLASLAHKLPVEGSGQVVCLRYLRGICPYQNVRNGGDCLYAHFEIKSSQLKKFVPLIDYVCGKAEDMNAGGRKSRRSHKHQQHGSYGSVGGSHRNEEGAHLMEAHLGGRGGGKKGKNARGRRRKGSIGDEDDGDSDGLARSDDGASEEGPSSRGSSPAPAPALSSSPQTFGSSRRAPLELQRLLNMELVKCSTITGVSLDAPCLVRVCLHGCTQLLFLDLWAPLLTSLDVSECTNLRSLPLRNQSLRGLKIANLTGCKNLNEAFVGRLVDHCRALRQLYIFGSGATEKAGNGRGRQKVGKAALAKLAAGRPKLELIVSKKDWRVLKAKREGVANSRLEEDGATMEVR